MSYPVFCEGICQGSVCTRVHFSGCITCRGLPVVAVVGISVPQGRNTVLVRQGFSDKQSRFRVIYLVRLQFLSVETCGCGTYLPFQGIVVGLDEWLSGFCYGYTEQSGFFGATPCGYGLFLSAVRVCGRQKVSPFIIFILCGSSLVVCIAQGESGCFIVAVCYVKSHRVCFPDELSEVIVFKLGRQPLVGFVVTL